MYCLPVLKRESHRVALVAAVAADDGLFILGTDSAPHEVGKKEGCCGCAGVFVGHASVELYAEVFEGVGKLDAMEGFFTAGRKHYGLEEGREGGWETVKLKKESWTVPPEYPFGQGKVVPLRGGEEVAWKIVE